MKTDGPQDETRNTAARATLWPRLAAAGVLCGILLLLTRSDLLHAGLIEVLHACEGVIRLHPLAGAALFVLLAGLSAMLAFVSVAVLVPVAIVVWGKPLSLILLWVGWIAGGLLAYAIGRFPGRAVVSRLASDQTTARLEARLRNGRASLWLVLLVQLALPSEIPGYVLGMLRYPLGRYLLALGLAELPYACATVYIGAGLVERRSGLILIFGGAVVALAGAAFLLLRSRLVGAGIRPQNAAALAPPAADD
jgi:uncharacterized membrane protein YdjX (TVP38/TMEM64 family)